MLIDNAVVRVVRGLQSHPLAKGPEVVAEVKGIARRLHPGQDSGRG